MKNYIDRYDRALERELGRRSIHQAAELYQAAGLCRKALQKIRALQEAHGFASRAEEIAFYKQTKPRFYSRYIYYVNLYQFQLQRPAGGAEEQRSYIHSRLAEVTAFFDRNRVFYSYYRSGATQLDEMYYTLGNALMPTEPEDFETGEQGTGYDYKLSKLLANEEFQLFLQRELKKLDQEAADGLSFFPLAHPAWTASQTDAIELIYALKAAGAINNGNIDIAELVTLFEFIFQIELKEYYHKYTDITRRKKEMAIFLTKLRDGLFRWVDDKLGL